MLSMFEKFTAACTLFEGAKKAEVNGSKAPSYRLSDFVTLCKLVFQMVEELMDISFVDPVVTRSYSFVFDREAYLLANPDVAADGMDSLVHWVTCGREEERRGERRNAQAPYFDRDYYLALYPDVTDLIHQGVYVSAAEHWRMSGLRDVAWGFGLLPRNSTLVPIWPPGRRLPQS